MFAQTVGVQIYIQTMGRRRERERERKILLNASIIKKERAFGSILKAWD